MKTKSVFLSLIDCFEWDFINILITWMEWNVNILWALHTSRFTRNEVVLWKLFLRMKRKEAIYSLRWWMNRCYLKKSTEGKSAKYNILYVFYTSGFLNNKKCVLWLLNLRFLKKKSIEKIDFISIKNVNTREYRNYN